MLNKINMNEFYLNEHNEIIQIISISQSEDLVTTITKDSIAKSYSLSKLKRIELGDDAIEGLYIVEYPAPMAAVVEPNETVPLRKNNFGRWIEFCTKASVKPANETSKYLCLVSPEFRNDNQIFFVDQLQEYLRKEGLGEVVLS